MKRIILSCIGLVFFASCQDELYRNDIQEYQAGQGIYLEGEKNIKLYIQAGQEYTMDNLAVKLVQPQKTEAFTKIISGSQSQLDSYNKENGTDYVLLPKEMYEIAESVSVPATSVRAVIPFKLKNITFTNGVNYALPIKLEGDGINSIPSQKESIVIIDEEMATKVLRVTGSGAGARNIFPNDYTVAQWTFEIMINRRAYSANNQALGGTNNVDGPLSEIFTRFGDVTIKPNQVQIKTGGAQIDVPEGAFAAKANEWYPLAFTYDGKTTRVFANGVQVASAEIREGAYSVTGFWLSGSPGLVREVRFWKKAIPEKTLKENMWKMVDPKSADLLFYYPLNGKKYDHATGAITEDETKLWDWSATGAHMDKPSGSRFDDNNGENHIFPPRK